MTAPEADRPRCVRPGDLARLTGARADEVNMLFGCVEEDLAVADLPRELRTRAAEHDALARRERAAARTLRQWSSIVERRVSGS